MRYTITARFPVSGRHWELTFTNGVAQTDSAVIAGNYRDRGYTVTEEVLADEPPDPPPVPDADPDPEPVPDTDPELEPEPEPESYICPVCEKAYKSVSALARHRKSHENTE